MIDGKNEEQEESNKVNFVAGNAKGGMPRVVRKELDEIRVKVDNALYDAPSTDLSGLSTEDYVSTTVSDALTDYATTGSLSSYSLTSHNHDGDYATDTHSHDARYTRNDIDTTKYGRLTISNEGLVASWVRATGGGDGGLVMRSWTANGAYASLATNSMTSEEYVLLSNGVTTLLGAGNGGAVYIRSDGNNSSNQSWQDSSGLHTAVLEVSNEIQLASGSSTDPSLTFSDDGNTGIYRRGEGELAITVNGVVHYFRTNGLHLADNDYIRTYGSGGWYNGTHTVGLHATDSSWIRIYNGGYSKGFYSNGGRVAVYYNPGGSLTESQRKDWSYCQVRAESTAYQGLAIRNVNDSGTVQLRPAAGILYIRNHNDQSYYAVHGGSYTTNSSIRYKQDVATWETPKSVGAAAGPEAVISGLAKVKAMRPVTYRMKREDYLSVSPLSERRKRAMMRLQDIRASRGMERFQSEELIHQCGRDCEGSVEEPCLDVRNWEKGHLGLISEELAEIAPEVVVDSDYGEKSGVDTYALVTVLVKAIQELSDEVDQLKAKIPAPKGN